jgi:hypothetical protein
MKLFRVTVETDLLVRAENSEDAEAYVQRMRPHEILEAGFDTSVSEVKSEKELSRLEQGTLAWGDHQENIKVETAIEEGIEARRLEEFNARQLLIPGTEIKHEQAKSPVQSEGPETPEE